MINTHSDYSYIIEKISENVLNTRYENFDQVTLENAKNRILDVLGCIISGASAAGNLALINLVKAWGGRAEAAILVHGGKVPAYHAAMVNSVMARSYDFEPVHAEVNGIGFPSHISGTTVPTAMTLAEAKNASGKELITALLVGDDLACRITAASSFSFNNGWDVVGTVNAIGATAVAGRLLGLTKNQIQNAFGIVLNQLAGSFQGIWDGAPTFKLLEGLSAKNGIFSAELAKVGWTGPKDAFLSRFGYFNLYSQGCANPEILIADIGKKYHAEKTFKPYPCCRANHAAVDCALKMVKDFDIEIDQIDEILIKVPSIITEMFVAQPFQTRAVPQIDAAFNMRFCVANVLFRKSITIEHFQEAYIKDPAVTTIMDKISLVEIDQNKFPKLEDASLRIIMKDRQEFLSETSFAKGNPTFSPFSKSDLKEKFLNNVAFSQTLSKDKAEKILGRIERLEEVGNIGDLTNLLLV